MIFLLSRAGREGGKLSAYIIYIYMCVCDLFYQERGGKGGGGSCLYKVGDVLVYTFFIKSVGAALEFGGQEGDASCFF